MKKEPTAKGRIKSETEQWRPLLVRQRVDGILLRRLERRIQRAGDSAGQGDQGSPRNPSPGHNHLQQRQFPVRVTARAARLNAIPSTMPPNASSTVSRSTTFTMYSFDAPIDFRMPISRVRSITAVYIA